MRYLGFVLFIAGLALGWWLLALIGFIMFEATGVTWISAVTSSSRIHSDHGGSHGSNNHGP